MTEHNRVKTFPHDRNIGGTLKHLEQRIKVLKARYGEDAELEVFISRDWGYPMVRTRIHWTKKNSS